MTPVTEEDKTAILDAFQRLMNAHCSEAQVRETMESAQGYDPILWKQLADMGILGLLVDPRYGGFGANIDLMTEIMAEMGACLYSGPFLSTSVWACSLLQACSDESIKQRLLPTLISGDTIVAIAATGDQGLWTFADVAVAGTQAEDGNGWHLQGSSSFVLHADAANTLLVLANTPIGMQVFEVDPHLATVESKPLPVNDPSLRLSRIEFNHCSATLLQGVGETEIDAAMFSVHLAVAAEHAGGARRIFDITVDYLKTRYQFGRPIGSYQALKHIAADLLIDVESAKTVVSSAAEAATQQRADANTLRYLAVFTCADVFREVSAQAIQLHGGIAYTKEHCAHLYWRRARSAMQLFGTPESHRELYLQSWEAVA